MRHIAPVSPLSISTRNDNVDRAAASRDIAKSAAGVSETVNGTANARATATAAKRASGAGRAGVGAAVDLVG